MCLKRFGNHWFSFFVFSPICPRAINNLKGHKKMSEPLNLFWLLFINRWSVIIHLRALFVLVFFWGPIYQVHFYIKIFSPCLSVIVKATRQQTDSLFSIFSFLSFWIMKLMEHLFIFLKNVSWIKFVKQLFFDGHNITRKQMMLFWQ